MDGNLSEQPRQGPDAPGKRLSVLLRRLSEAASEPAARDASRFELAALEAVGQRGYGRLTVREIVGRAGLSRTRFYRLFSSKEDCFVAAYEWVAVALVGELLAIGRAAGDWETGLRMGLEELAGLVAHEREVTTAIVVEARGVEGVAALRKEVSERLSRAIDTARREIPSRHSPPPSSAQFILCMIESTMSRTLAGDDPDRFRATIPDLTRIAGAIYFDA